MSRVLPAALALLATAVAAAPAVATPTNAELISRATGAGGAEYASAELQVASPDGRFVVFTAEDDAVNGPDFLYLRDRQTKTTVPVLRDASGAPTPASRFSVPTARALDVSDDGKSVLVETIEPYAYTPIALLRVDVATGEQTVVSTDGTGHALGTVGWWARFTNGGSGVVYSGGATEGKPDVYRRAFSAAAPTIAEPNATLTGGTRDGKVVVWSRVLIAAQRPAGVGNTGPLWPTTRAGSAVGYTIAGQPGQVVGRTRWAERLNIGDSGGDSEYCPQAGVGYVRTDYGLTIDEYGHTLVRSQRSEDSAFPSGEGGHPPTRTVFDVAEDGSSSLVGTSYWGYPGTSVTREPAAGVDASTLPALPTLLQPYDASTVNARYFAHDTGILRTEFDIKYGEPSVRAVYAYDPVATGTAPQARTPAPLGYEIADDQTMTPRVLWRDCTASFHPGEIGDVRVYADVNLATPLSAARSAGSVWVTPTPSSSVRAADRVKLTIKTFGVATWSRTVTASEGVRLPKPWWLVPQTLEVTVQGDANSTQGYVAQTRTLTARWTATRFN